MCSNCQRDFTILCWLRCCSNCSDTLSWWVGLGQGSWFWVYMDSLFEFTFVSLGILWCYEKIWNQEVFSLHLLILSFVLIIFFCCLTPNPFFWANSLFSDHHMQIHLYCWTWVQNYSIVFSHLNRWYKFFNWVLLGIVVPDWSEHHLLETCETKGHWCLGPKDLSVCLLFQPITLHATCTFLHSLRIL